MLKRDPISNRSEAILTALAEEFGLPSAALIWVGGVETRSSGIQVLHVRELPEDMKAAAEEIMQILLAGACKLEARPVGLTYRELPEPESKGLD